MDKQERLAFLIYGEKNMDLPSSPLAGAIGLLAHEPDQVRDLYLSTFSGYLIHGRLEGAVSYATSVKTLFSDAVADYETNPRELTRLLGDYIGEELERLDVEEGLGDIFVAIDSFDPDAAYAQNPGVVSDLSGTTIDTALAVVPRTVPRTRRVTSGSYSLPFPVQSDEITGDYEAVPTSDALTQDSVAGFHLAFGEDEETESLRNNN